MESLYKSSLCVLVNAIIPVSCPGPWKFSLKKSCVWNPIFTQFLSLVYEDASTFDSFFESFWHSFFIYAGDTYSIEETLPILDPSAKQALLGLLHVPFPHLLLPDLWNVLLARECEIVFLRLWDNFIIYREYFTKQEVEKKFKGSQLLYPFFKTRLNHPTLFLLNLNSGFMGIPLCTEATPDLPAGTLQE